MYSMGTNRMRMRMFHTQSDVHPNHIFCPVVTAPSSSADYKPRVDWSKFHEVIALEQEELQSPHLQHVSRAWGALSSKFSPINTNDACLCVLLCSYPTCCTCNHYAQVLLLRHQTQSSVGHLSSSDSMLKSLAPYTFC